MPTINQYHYFPSLKLHKIENDRDVEGSRTAWATGKPLYMGFELEVECPGQNIGSVYETAWSNFGETCDETNFFATRDGSLSNGFEIVSQPRTLRSHKLFAWKKWMKALVQAGAKSHDTNTCGMHVHMSKDFLTPRQWVRFAYFIYSQNDLVLKLARRTPNRYCKARNVSRITAGDVGVRGRDRYFMVNFTPGNTVEVRIFKGTLKYDTFMATLEFMHAVAFYTRDEYIYNLSNHPKALINFVNYVFKHKNLYSKLAEWLSANGYSYTEVASQRVLQEVIESL